MTAEQRSEQDAPFCPYCQHAAEGHVEFRPQGALTLYTDVLACTDHTTDPLTGQEYFCDCIWPTNE